MSSAAAAGSPPARGSPVGGGDPSLGGESELGPSPPAAPLPTPGPQLASPSSAFRGPMREGGELMRPSSTASGGGGVDGAFNSREFGLGMRACDCAAAEVDADAEAAPCTADG